MTTLRVSLGAALVAFAAYAMSASRTITWWDGSSYPLAACTLGITGSPGSVMLTLLGWIASRAPVVHPIAFQLNLVAGCIAAAVVALVTRLTIVLVTPPGRAPRAIELLAGGVAGLTLAFGVSLWSYATQFTPYILTALFTALILTAAMAWWRRAETADATSVLFLLFLLFGLDLSVHRTNVLLMPAAIAWMLLRRPAVWRRVAPWCAAAGGLALGLAFHLVLIPMARRDPAFNIDDPRDLASLWSYITLERAGGGFLINLFPRASDFVRVQLADYVGFLQRNLWPAGAPLAGASVVLLGLAGCATALRRDARRTLGLLSFYLCASLGAVVYFNLPAHYFRGMERHYLPSLVILIPLVGIGAHAVLGAIGGAGGGRERLALAIGFLLLLVPASQWAANRRDCDLSRNRFAETYSRDVLAPLPRDAILISNGDNDTFPLWYLQQVEHVRPDVSVINLPLLNTRTYLGQLRRRVPGLATLLLREQGRGVIYPVYRADTAVTVPIAAAALPDGAPTHVAPQPAVFKLNGLLLGQDLALLDLLRLNGWRRPIFLSCTVSRDLIPWLWPYARFEGLAYRIIPAADLVAADVERTRHVLMEETRYAGVADTTIRLDPTSRAMCGNYAAALLQLARVELDHGNADRALETIALLERRVPPNRLGFPAGLVEQVRAEAWRLTGRSPHR